MAAKVFDLVPLQTGLAVEFEDPIAMVFDFWKALIGHERSQLGAKRRAVIKRALEMGYSVDDLRLAIVGCRVDAWSNGQNDRQRAYNDIELICRDETKIDQFLQIGEARLKQQIAKEKEQAASDESRAAAVPMPPEIRARLDALFKNAKGRAKP